MATEISTALIACLKLFSALLAQDHPEAFHEVPCRLWQDELGRLRVWSANIGAHQTGQSSLDYRLRDASHIKNQVVKLLEEYYLLLHEFDTLLHNHDSGQTVQGGDFFDDDFASDNDNETELQNIYGTLVKIMGSLFKMSMIIRHPAQHDRLLNSRREDSLHFEQPDRSHVMEKFPRANPMIIHRLGAAISRRRRDLKYRERHHQKLSRGLDRALDGAGEAQSTAMSSTVASEYDEEAHIDMTDSLSESGMTQTSVANSLFEPGNPITIPPPPKASANREFFECPYCYIVITIRNRSDWARHIFRDILPYVCIFPDCHSSNRLYATRREWSKHIQDQHVSLVSATEVGTKCPLCNDDAQGMTEMGLQRHVGRHLEDLALFAVPRGNPEHLEEEEDEEEEDEEEEDKEEEDKEEEDKEEEDEEEEEEQVVSTVSSVSSVNFKDHTKSRSLTVRENGRLVVYKFPTIPAKLEWIRKHRTDLLPPPPSLPPPSPSLLPLPPPPSSTARPVATTQDGPYRTLNEIDIGTFNENYDPVTNNTTSNTTNYNLTYNYSPQVPVTSIQVGNLMQGSGGLFDGPALPALPAPRRRH